jgi:Tol biopolymer transport system component
MPATVSGTPLYMAPELFEERRASVASDIYSLGVLLFYLLSGRWPVEGASIDDLRQAHATGARTRLRDLRPELPEAVVQVVERASAPVARDRYQTAGELEHALIGTSGLQMSALAMAGVRQKRGWVTWASVGIAALALTALAFGGSLRRPAADRPLVHFSISPPDNTGSWPRVSPDGRMVVYGSSADGRETLWLRRLEDIQGRPIPHTSARESPFWSPDSRSLAFFEYGKLKKVAIAGGGQPQTLADALLPRGGDWNRADVLLFGTEAGLFRVGADGNGLAAVTTLDPARGEYSHGWPEFLPDGRRFLFVVRSTQPQHAGLYLGRLDSPERTRVMPVLSRTVYSAAGYLLFAQESSLLAQRFDARTATLSGVPELVAAPIKHHPSSDGAFDVADGVLIYRLSEGLPMTRLMLYDRDGQSIKAIGPVAAYRHPRLSPDGQRVVAERLESITANPDLWLFDLVRQMASRFTTSEAPDVSPAWSPDGRQIAFSSKRGGRYDVYVQTVDEVTPDKLLWGTDGDKIIEDWSPDGRWLVGSIARSGLWRAPVDGTGAPELLRATSSSERWLAEFSPDGRWMAYTSFESGGPEVYLAPLGRSDARWQVSARGGADPHWREDGRELFYLTLDGQIASVEVSPTDGAWQPGRSRMLFSVNVPEPAGTSDFDVARDGRTFVVNTLLGYPAVPPVQVVLNWTNLLKR